MIVPDDVRLDSKAAYAAALDSWAARTTSSPEPRWRGPGTYRFGGYMDDDGRPVATLERRVDVAGTTAWARRSFETS